MSDDQKKRATKARKERPLFEVEVAGENERTQEASETATESPARLMRPWKIQFDSLEDARENLGTVVKTHLGRGVFVSSIREPKAGTLSATLGINKSYLYWNRDEPILKYVKLGAVESILVEKSAKKFRAHLPSYVEFHEKAHGRANDSFHSYENRLLESIHGRLATVANVRNTLTPIATLLGQVRADGSVSTRDFVQSRRSREQAMKYVKFLEGIEFITVKGELIEAGPRLQKYRVRTDDPASVVTTKILGDVLEQGHDYLTRYLKLTGLLPFLRVANAYYTPSAQVHRKLTVSIENLNVFHSYIYGSEKPRLQLAHQVDEVVEAEILHRESGSKLLTGDEGITKRWLSDNAAVAA